MKNRRVIPFLLLIPFMLVTAAVIAAVINVMVQGLGYIKAFGLTDFTLDYYKEVLRRPDFAASLLVSLRIAVFSSVIASVLGTVICAALIRCRQASGGMLTVVRLPILVPHAVVAVFTVALLSQTGIIPRILYALGLLHNYNRFPDLLYGTSYTGAILAYIWKESPFVAYFTLALMKSVGETLGEAAENLGASPLRSFLDITLPMSMPAIAQAFLMIFIFAFGGYEVPLLLGATKPKAFPVATYIEFQAPNLKDRPYAMAMNGITLILSVVMALIYAVLMHRLLKKRGGRA